MSKKSDHPSQLIIRNVSKRFSDVVAVDDISLTIEQGEFFSLLGSSGCGKTTLLRMMGGFETPNEGEIIIDGAVVTALPAEKRPTNMVFQNYALFPHLSVRDNIAYGLRRDRLAKSEINRRVGEALDMIKLSDYGSRKPDQLSGGQRQRVALARALIKRPKVLLLDEPLGALDKQLREQMQLELRTLQRSLGTTFVFVTHDQEEALGMSDRVAVMSAGKTLQIATPHILYEQPACLQVARFVGDMNFLDGVVRASRGKEVVVECAFGSVTAHVTGQSLSKGTACLVAIRPERLHFVNGDLPESLPCVEGVIRTRTYWGDQSHYHIEVDGSGILLTLAEHNARGEAANNHDSGALVKLSASADAFLAFPT